MTRSLVHRSARGWALVSALALAAGCPQLKETPEELHLVGTLDRDSIEGSSSVPVEVAYHSSGARAEWWPCDLRLTAQACVGEHHVNVYVTLPSVTGIGGVGGAACVSGDEANGVYELLAEARGGEHTLGVDLNAFVLVASDMDDAPGAVLNDDEETTAATRIVGGKLAITHWAGLMGLSLTIEGTTQGGREISIDFSGPASSPGEVPMLEGPSTCVDAHLP